MRSIGTTLPWQVLPHAFRMFLKSKLPQPKTPVIEAGSSFSSWALPDPLIPYDRIYGRRLARSPE
jgi:hypothetical protein